MISRRTFLQQSSAAGFFLSMNGFDSLLPDEKKPFAYRSDFIKLELAAERPRLLFFSTDSLGKGQLEESPLLDDEPPRQAIPGDTVGTRLANLRTADVPAYSSEVTGNRIAYYNADSNGAGSTVGKQAGNSTSKRNLPAWEFTCRDKTISIRTRWKKGQTGEPFGINFSQKLNHSTVLGALSGDKQVKFPCVLHLPAMGSFRVHCSDPDITLFYDAFREVEKPFVYLQLPAAGEQHPDITYTFDSVAIFPDIPTIKNDPRFDGFRRNYINIFQLNPRLRVLANNSASDPCALTMYMYTEMARKTPELVKGLTAMDLVRHSLDRYLAGMKSYGQVGYKPPNGWQSEYDTADTGPSLIIAACYYILDTKDRSWAAKNYPGVREWALNMIATDRNGDGLIEYGYSGNANSWDDKNFHRPSNWWDTIGFGHDDAYSNALAYRACTLLSEVASGLGNTADADRFSSFAGKLKRVYYKTFYNPETGVLAGWRSADGKLHDYYFTFVNGAAITYGLIEDDAAKEILRKLLSKMKEVGYTDFRLGLPGNLVSIRREDYVPHIRRWGGGKKEDGSDGFQIYENGGATACHAWFTLHALFRSGMREEAEGMLFPMLESFANGGFEGRCPGSEMTKDWKTWKGECWGYEGFLVDNYLTLLSVWDYADAKTNNHVRTNRR